MEAVKSWRTLEGLVYGFYGFCGNLVDVAPGIEAGVRQRRVTSWIKPTRWPVLRKGWLNSLNSCPSDFWSTLKRNGGHALFQMVASSMIKYCIRG
jgi:hypothetical protein